MLPRWGRRSPIRHHADDSARHRGQVGWASRAHWLAHTVPQALAARPEVLSEHHVAADTLARWCSVKSLYAQQERSGQAVIVRPDTIAGLMQVSLSTVHRCQAAARELGLEVVISMGRMLTQEECLQARRAGSPQRGLSTVSAFAVPAWLPRPVVHDTPTSGRGFSSSVTDCFTFKKRQARWKRAPLRSARHQQTGSPGWSTACELVDQVIFLHRCPPGRLTGQLQRFQTAPKPWSATRIIRAMDQVNVRLGYTAPARAKQAPWALLAWYLNQIDPVADHPDFTGSFPT